MDRVRGDWLERGPGLESKPDDKPRLEGLISFWYGGLYLDLSKPENRKLLRDAVEVSDNDIDWETEYLVAGQPVEGAERLVIYQGQYMWVCKTGEIK